MVRPYTVEQPFRFWCQKILPLVYDDSLSYYELLNKVVDYLNKNVDNVNALGDAFNSLQKYVQDYFTNLDVQQEINAKLDEMVEDGTLDELILPLVGDAVSDWLEENVTPTGSAVLVDSTLTISGASADAKVTGDEISDLKSAIDKLYELKTLTNLGNETGQLSSSFMAGGIFTEPTYIYSFSPKFVSSSGTFKYAVVKFNKNATDASARGTYTLSASQAIGTPIVFDKTFGTDEGLLVIADSPYQGYGGTALNKCELTTCVFVQMAGTSSSAYVSNYFSTSYGFSADFTIKVPKGNDKVIAVNGGDNGTIEDINNGIQASIDNGYRHLALYGNFTISDSIKIPSNFVLELVNAKITLARGANTNIIATANIADLSQAENITIIGRNSLLDGNYSNQNISTDSYKRIGVLFFNVTNFDISGITIKNTHAWGMSFESGCANGKIHDIHITQDGGSVNQDGIDIRGGCHDIEIYNITGLADDDCIACTAMLGNVLQVLNDGSNGADIYNINIHDIFMESRYCNVIDLIAHDGAKNHDIQISNIHDTAPNNKTIRDSGVWNNTISIGNYDFENYAISGNPGTKNDLFGITICNVVSSSKTAIKFGWNCSNVTIDGIKVLYNNEYMIKAWCYQNLDFDVDTASIKNGDYPSVGSGRVFNNINGIIDKMFLSDIDVVNCYRFFENTGAITNMMVVDCNILEVYNFIINNTSAPFFDRCSIASYTTLYNPDRIGSAIIGDFMPYKS